MQYLDLTLPTPEENVALDEALLETAEAGAEPSEVLRLWEPQEMVVVVGRSSQVPVEVDVAACRADGVTILRRTSGGLSIVAGPGCLMYSLVLSYERRPHLRSLDTAHRFVLNTLIGGLERFSTDIACQGTSDLALRNRKFSGNSVRCKRNHLLYHGTLLYDFPLAVISRYLAQPPRAPDYRQGRSHDAFVTNLPADAASLRAALKSAWQAGVSSDDWPRAQVAELVAEKYSRPDWNFRH
jgi:lipoate-protein ligase A